MHEEITVLMRKLEEVARVNDNIVSIEYFGDHSGTVRIGKTELFDFDEKKQITERLENIIYLFSDKP